MAADNASTNIQREAPFLEDYRRRLMDSVFAATKDAIVPGERDIAGYDPFQTAGFGEAASQLGYTFDPETGSMTKSGQAVFEPHLQQGLAGMQQGQQTAAQGMPALQRWAAIADAGRERQQRGGTRSL